MLQLIQKFFRSDGSSLGTLKQKDMQQSLIVSVLQVLLSDNGQCAVEIFHATINAHVCFVLETV